MHTCFFDIDGTLISTGGAGKLAMEAALASAFGVTDPTEGIPAAGRTDRAITRDLFAYHGIDDTRANRERFVAAYLQHLPVCLRELEGRVLPGISELLEQLTNRPDVTLALLTGNIREGARHKLSHFGLYHHFRFGVFGERHCNRDDVARDALLEVQRLNGSADPNRIWVIGDTPFDVACGRAIGARVIAVATGGHSLEELQAARPDLVLPDFSNPQAVLELWL